MIGRNLVRIIVLFAAGLLFLLMEGRDTTVAAQPSTFGNRIRIYDASGTQQGGSIQTSGPGRVVTTSNRMVVIDSEDTRVRIFDLSGNLQNDEIRTASRADVVTNGNLIPVIEDARIRIFTLFGFQQGATIHTSGRASVVPLGNTFIVIEDRHVQIYDLFANPVGQVISTNERATVVTGNTRFAVIDEERVRIYDLLGNRQRGEIATDGPGSVVATTNLFIVVDDTGVHFFTLFGDPQGAVVNTRGRADIATASDHIIVADDQSIRIYDPSGAQQGSAISTTGRASVAAGDDFMAIIDNRRVRIYNLFGFQQGNTITTNSPTTAVTTADRIVVIEEARVRVYNSFGFLQGNAISTAGRAEIRTPASTIVIVDNAGVRLYNHFGLPQGTPISTVGRAIVSTTDDSIGVNDDNRVRIYNYAASQRGGTIGTIGRVNLFSISDRFIILDEQDEPIEGLTASSDSPTVLGNATRLTASVSAGSNISYTWDFGDGATGNGADVTHTYAQAGSYTATVTAGNSAGTRSATTLVTVTDVAPANDARFVSQTVPSVMEAGQTANVSITMKNTGTTTWTAAGGYKLGTQNPPDNTLWTGSSRQLLHASDVITPGHQKSFTFTITAPTIPGTYNFQWRMLQEETGAEWFGSLTPNIVITVRDPNSDDPPGSSWENDRFDELTPGPLDGQNGWTRAAPDRASARVVADAGGKILEIEAVSGTTIVMGKDVPDQIDGRHTLTFRVRVTDATLPSVAKIEVGTIPGSGWNKKFQLYFGSSMRVNNSPDGAATVFVPNTISGRWYHIRVEMDLAQERLDVWVDNHLAAGGVGMYPGPITSLGLSGWDRPGVVYLDNLVGLKRGSSGSEPIRQLKAASTFNTGDEGWRVISDEGGSAQPDYVATGGNPGGYVSANDDLVAGVWYWQAPAQFLGNLSSAYDGALTFDLKQPDTSNQFDGEDVILSGGGLTLVFDAAHNPGANWISYRVPLNETAGWIKQGTEDAPSQAEMQRVLSSLSELLIRGEHGNSPNAGGLDNVALFCAGKCVEVKEPVFWINPAGGSWTEPSNWSIDAVPNHLHHAHITLTGRYTVTVNTELTVGQLTVGTPGGQQTLWIRGETRNTVLIVQENLDNAGTILLESQGTNTWATTLWVINGVLLNSGTIVVNEGIGGVRLIKADVVNEGSVHVNHDLTYKFTFSNSGLVTIAAGKTMFLRNQDGFNQNGGVVASDGLLELIGAATLNFTGGTFTGTPPFLSSFAALNISPLAVGAAGFTVTGSSKLSGTVHAGQTIWVRSFGNTILPALNVEGKVTNAGIIDLDSEGGAFSSWLLINEVLTNTGTIRVSKGNSGTHRIQGSLINQGTVDINHDFRHIGVFTNLGTVNVNDLSHGSVFTNLGTVNIAREQKFTFFNPGRVFNQDGGTIAGDGFLEISFAILNFNGGNTSGTPPLVSDSTLNFGPAATGEAQFVLRGSSNLNGHMGPGQSVWIRADTSVAHVTAGHGFINDGTIRMESEGTTREVRLVIPNGTITNTGTIDVNAGAGGARRIRGNVVNQGILNVSTDLVYDNLVTTAVTFTNRGIINIANGRTMTVQSGETLDNVAGGVIQGSGILNVTRAIFNNGGEVRPGFGVGRLQIIGNYSQLETSILSIEIDRNLPDGSDFDQLQVGDAATLGGTLNVSTTQTASRPLNIGDSFVILTCGRECTGSFDAANGLDLGNGRVFDVRYSNREVTLEVVENGLDVEPEKWIIYLPIINR